MADISINAVSNAFTGTDSADDFQNGTGNLRDITVAGLSGDDLLSFGSAVQAGTGDGGKGLGFSLGSSDLNLGAGDDTLTFSGQAGSGFAQFKASTVKLGDGADYALINGLASASASTIRGNDGADEITFAGISAGASTAHNVLINANGDDDSVSVTWTSTEAKGFGVLGGAGTDTISAEFGTISADGDAKATFTGAKVGGNKGADEIYARVIGTSDQVRINGNSGNDTIIVTASEDSTLFGIAGGKGDDVISANFIGANSSHATTVAGSLGNDTVGVSFSGGHVSGVQQIGASGDDVLTFSNQGAVLTASTGNSILGGTGADTITVNLGANLVVTGGASGFVADLGAAGVVSGGTAGVGGVIDVNLSATLAANTGGGAFFRGTTTGDDIDISNVTGAAGLSRVTFSAEDGADSITFSTESGGSYSGNVFNAGSGADVITAQISGATDFSIGTAGDAGQERVAFLAGSGADTMVINIGDGSRISAGLFDGGAGADSLTLNLLSGGSASVVQSGTELAGGAGNDTIALAATLAATAEVVIRGGAGDDVVTGTFATGGVTNGAFTADGGSGADTIAFTYTASYTGGRVAIAGANGAVFGGGSGADSINVVAVSVTGGTFDFGSIRGGAGADSITFGGFVGNSGGETFTATGSIDGGAGADSIVFSGNNVISGGAGVFAGADANGTAGFVLRSGDSLIGGYDTIFVSNNDVTGGQTMQAGTFGSAGFDFQEFSAADFTLSVDATFVSAGNANKVLLNDAKFVAVSGGVRQNVGAMTGGLIGAYSGGTNASAGKVGAFVLSGGSTLTQIFSAVDASTDARGTVSVFNVQNGSAGTVDGFMFIQGGIAADHIIKFAGNGLTAGSFEVGDGYFSAGGDAALKSSRTNSQNSGGNLFFGANVGIG